MTAYTAVRAAEDRARSSRENRVLDGPPRKVKIEPLRFDFDFSFFCLVGLEVER